MGGVKKSILWNIIKNVVKNINNMKIKKNRIEKKPHIEIKFLLSLVKKLQIEWKHLKHTQHTHTQNC